MTVTTERLFIAGWASFGVTHVRDVILALDYGAVMTRLTICAPIVRLITISDSSYLISVDNVRLLALSFFDLFRPLCGHFDPVIDNVFFRHSEAYITNKMLLSQNSCFSDLARGNVGTWEHNMYYQTRAIFGLAIQRAAANGHSVG